MFMVCVVFVYRLPQQVKVKMVGGVYMKDVYFLKCA